MSDPINPKLRVQTHLAFASAFAIAFVLLFSPAAQAQNPQKRVTVGPVLGKGAPRIEKILLNQLSTYVDIEVIPFAQARQVQRSLGGQSWDTQGLIPKVAAQLDLSAFLQVVVQRQRRGLVARIVVREGATGQAIHQQVWRARRFPGLVAQAAQQSLTAINQGVPNAMAPQSTAPAQRQMPSTATAAPPPPTPAPQQQPSASSDDPFAQSDAAPPGFDDPFSQQQTIDDDEPEVEDSKPRKRGEGKLVEVSAGGSFFTRTFRYNDDIFDLLRSYQLGGAPRFDLGLEIFPLRAFTDGLASNFGLYGEFNQAISLVSKTSDGLEFPTTAGGFGGGLMFAQSFGDLTVIPSVGYHQQNFAIADADNGTPKPEIPDVSYGHVQLQLAVNYQINKELEIGVQTGYYYVLDAGEIAESPYFPNLSVAGIGAEAYASYLLWQGLGLRLSGHFERFFYTLNPEPGDSKVAGGAIDQYIMGSLSVFYRY